MDKAGLISILGKRHPFKRIPRTRKQRTTARSAGSNANPSSAAWLPQEHDVCIHVPEQSYATRRMNESSCLARVKSFTHELVLYSHARTFFRHCCTSGARLLFCFVRCKSAACSLTLSCGTTAGIIILRSGNSTMVGSR